MYNQAASAYFGELSPMDYWAQLDAQRAEERQAKRDADLAYAETASGVVSEITSSIITLAIVGAIGYWLYRRSQR